MALFLEDDKKVLNKKVPISRAQKREFKKIAAAEQSAIENNVPGSKKAKSLSSDKNYNKKDKNAKNNKENSAFSNGYFTYNDAKTELHRMSAMDPQSLQYKLHGDQTAVDMYRDALRRLRTVNKVDKVQPVKPASKGGTKPSKTKVQTIKKPNAEIKITVEEKKPKKKIFISEQQILTLKRYGRY